MLSFTQYKVILQVTEPIVFNKYPGFYLRNALVSALSAYCMNPDRKNNQKIISCKACPLQENCLYHALNLPVDKDVETPKVMPFMVDASKLITGKYEKGYMEFELTLFGKASRYIEIFCSSIEIIGRYYGIGDKRIAMCFKLQSVQKTKTFHVADSLQNPVLGNENTTLYFRQLILSKNRMLELKENRAQEAPLILPFDYLLQIIGSRINALDSCYGEGPELLNIQPPAIENKIFHTEQFALCNYQYPDKDKKGYRFINGNCTYTNVPANCMNLLELGSKIGIGHFTAYGFGIYTINHG